MQSSTHLTQICDNALPTSPYSGALLLSSHSCLLYYLHLTYSNNLLHNHVPNMSNLSSCITTMNLYHREPHPRHWYRMLSGTFLLPRNRQWFRMNLFPSQHMGKGRYSSSREGETRKDSLRVWRCWHAVFIWARGEDSWGKMGIRQVWHGIIFRLLGKNKECVIYHESSECPITPDGTSGDRSSGLACPGQIPRGELEDIMESCKLLTRTQNMLAFHTWVTRGWSVFI